MLRRSIVFARTKGGPRRFLSHVFGGSNGPHRSKRSTFAGASSGSRLALGLGIGLGGSMLMGGTVLAQGNSRSTDEETLVQKASATAQEVLKPILDPFRGFYEYFAGDQSPLVPPQPADQYGRTTRVLVLGFENTLVYPFWTRDDGWCCRKRPHVQAFLERTARAGYEIVLFSSALQMDMEANVNDLDAGFAKHRLYREHTNFKNGSHIKDISRLQRPLKDIIVIDADFDETGSLNPENCINISRFKDSISDTELARLTVLLEKIQEYNVYDVRDVIKKYNTNPTQNIFVREEALKRQAQRLLEEQGRRR